MEGALLLQTVGLDIAERRKAAAVLQQPRHVHEVPAHEDGVALGEGVGRAAAFLVGVGRAGPDLADPAGLGLGRDRVADVRQGVQHRHADVLHPVLIARDHAAAGLAVEDVLALLVGLPGMGVEPLEKLAGHRAFLAEPDRRADDEDVGGRHALPDLRPVVARPALLGHVRLDAEGDLVIHQTHAVHAHSGAGHDGPAHIHQRVGVGRGGRPLQRAVDEQRLEVVIARRRLLEIGIGFIGHGLGGAPFRFAPPQRM